jgi:hypothetical protein
MLQRGHNTGSEAVNPSVNGPLRLRAGFDRVAFAQISLSPGVAWALEQSALDRLAHGHIGKPFATGHGDAHPGAQHAPNRMHRPEATELGRRSVFHAWQRALVKRDMAGASIEAWQDKLVRGFNDRVVRGLRSRRGVQNCAGSTSNGCAGSVRAVVSDVSRMSLSDMCVPQYVTPASLRPGRHAGLFRPSRLRHQHRRA